MDRLTSLRAPLATAALVALTLVALARVVLGLYEAFSTGGSAAVAAARLAPNGGDGALTVLVAVLVVACFAARPTPARRALAAWGAALCAVSLAASLVALGLADLEVAGWSVVWLVPELVVPALVGIGLVALSRAPEVEPVADPAPPSPTEDATTSGPAPEPDLQPAWPEDVAAGAVWRTAGEAARGAPASGWDPGHDAAWPSPAPPDPSAPSAASAASLPATGPEVARRDEPDGWRSPYGRDGSSPS